MTYPPDPLFAADCLAETVKNWLEQECPGGAILPWEKDAEAALAYYRRERAAPPDALGKLGEPVA